MSATARCPHCSKTVATPPDWDGAIFPCPSCGGKVGLLESVGAQEPGLLGLMHLLPAAWAGLVVWWTRRHETWMCTSRGAWLIGMGLAYALGLGTGICVSVFN